MVEPMEGVVREEGLRNGKRTQRKFGNPRRKSWEVEREDREDSH